MPWSNEPTFYAYHKSKILYLGLLDADLLNKHSNSKYVIAIS